MKNLKLVEMQNNTRTKIKVGNLVIGEEFLMAAGPCSVESEEQIIEIAYEVKRAGANMLRGGAFKPRTSPYSFQGLGRYGLQYLKKAGNLVGLPIVTEVLDTRDVFMISEYADVLQIGARNMQNFSLLVEVGKTNKPVILKRGMYATIEEWLNCAEYIMKEGNPNVILCERGIRTIENYTRFTLDLSAVAALHGLTHLPLIVDPSHATGRTELILPMSISSVMAGCDGLIIEVHTHPEKALSDADQQLTPSQYIKTVEAVTRSLSLRNELEI